MTQDPPDRRQQILDAALACFLAQGYLATSMSDIRRHSGASTGSIYHFFAGKAEIAEYLLREAVSGWSQETVPAGESAEADIKASVRGLALWGLANPQLARFLDEMRGLASTGNDLARIRDLFEAGQAAAASRFARMQAEGAVRKLPFSIAHALMLGPVYSFLRQAQPTPPDQARRVADLFAEAAWQAVRR